MAAENHYANPTIIEPAPSSDDESPPPRLLTPSLNTSSTSNSFESSRPHSRGSSATSPSESSPPSPTNADSHKVSDISPPNPSNHELPTSNTARPIPSVTSEPVEGSSHGNMAAWLSLCQAIFSRRRWLEHTLGVFTLVASLVGLLFIGVRTYKLAVISTENSTLDACTDLIQAGFATLENSTPLCKAAMKNGPLSSPYHLGKRALHDTLALPSRWMKRPPTQRCDSRNIACQSREADTVYQKISTPAMIISTTLALGVVILIMARRNARATEVFTSPARSDIQITHHDESEPKMITGQGIIERHKPEDHQNLDLLRKRIRASQDQDSLMKDTASLQSTNSSSTTLVDGRSIPHVSLEDRSSGEKHEGLIELQLNCKTKAYFRIETGELFHLKHWERQHNHDSNSSSENDNPNSNGEQDYAETSPGASALAMGKAVKDKWIEELQHEHEKWHIKHSHATQQVGDCIAGLLTNQLPTGKPQTF